MQLIRLDKLDDPRLEVYRNLKKTNVTRWTGEFITEGKKPTVRLLQSDFEVTSVLASEKHVDVVEPYLVGRRADVPLYVMPHTMCQILVGFQFHAGVLGCGVRKPTPKVSELIRPGERQLFVICPSTENRDNLGAIIRIAAAFGVSGIFLGKGCCEAFVRRTIRVSMGYALSIPIVEAGANLPSLVKELHDEHNVELVGSALDENAEVLANADVDSERSCAILLGNEDAGLNSDWIELCDRVVTIPMHGGIDSLNVSVAAGILLHHFAGSP